MEHDPRSRLPNRPDASERPVFPAYKVAGGRLPPGPGRRYDKRHFLRMESGGAILMWILLAVALFWIGVDLGMLPDVFGWHGPDYH